MIEKDWLSFGHQFRFRNGMYNSKTDPKASSEDQKSPIFIQFLDAVYQLIEQNLTKFEFNSELLYFLAFEIFTGNYGTFMFNNENERDLFDAREKTVSIWTMVKLYENNFTNKIYKVINSDELEYNYKRIKLWDRYFLRYEKDSKRETIFYNRMIGYESQMNAKMKNVIKELVKVINEKNIENLENQIKEESLSKETREYLIKNNLRIEKKELCDSFEIYTKSKVNKEISK